MPVPQLPQVSLDTTFNQAHWNNMASPYQHRLRDCFALSPCGQHHRAGRGE